MYHETIFDIDGIEYYVISKNYSKKFNIELYYGRLEEKARSKPALVLTQTLKQVILENEVLRAKDFGEFLSSSTVNKLRRRLKGNPYKSYRDWLESSNLEKPQEIRFLDVSKKPELIIDYFGIQHVLFSARIVANGMVLFVGTPIDKYKINRKFGKTYIVTEELAEFIKKHRYHPVQASEALGIDVKSSKQIRKVLGYDKNPEEEVNIWLSAHLDRITTMSKNAFVLKYMQNIEMGKSSVVRNLKHGLYLLKTYVNAIEKDKRSIVHIVRTLDKKPSHEVMQKLMLFIDKERARRCIKAYKVLILAREYKHAIPRGYKAILKKKKLQ